MRASAHHASKSWTTSWYDDQKKRRCKRFGRVDQVNKKVAAARYQHWLSTEWRIKNHVRSPGDPDTYTVQNLADAFLANANKVYRKNGRLTSQIDQVQCAMTALTGRYSEMPADAIGAPQIAALRDSMVQGVKKTLTLSTINARLRIIKQAYKWARTYGLVSREAVYDISIVPPLKAGETDAKLGRVIQPVPKDILEKTLAGCTATLAAMIRLQSITGMRSGEMCALRVCDIERSDKVWDYAPLTHKTEHHGKVRKINFGPESQKILKPFLAKRKKLDEYVFLPAEAHQERLQQIGFEKVAAYQTSRSNFIPGRKFSAGSYYSHVCRTCDIVFDADGKRRAARDFRHRWHPHRLRHNAATTYRERFGIEAATDVLGHSNFNTAKIYAERSEKRIKEMVAVAG